jgi:hypothetical protein
MPARGNNAGMPSPAFDPSLYPGTYRHWIVYRIFVSLFGAIIAIAAIGGLTSPRQAEALPGSWWWLLLMAAAGVALIVYPWRRRVVLGPTFIETRGLRSRRIERAEILRFRCFRVKDARTYLLYTTSRPRPVAVKALGHDAAFRAWFAGLPNADARDLAANLTQVALDPRLGTTPQERLQAAARAQRLARGALVVGLVLLFCARVYPYPRLLVLGLEAALVPAAILLATRYKGRFGLGGMSDSGRGDLSIVMATAILGLGYRALTDVRPVSWSGLMLAAVVAAVALALTAIAAAPEMRLAQARARLIFTTIGFGLYAAGVLALVNGEFDTTPGASQVVTVTHARKVGIKSPDTYLTVSQVPADIDSTELSVAMADYRRYHVGDRLCLRERDGALGWHWLQLGDASACPPN